MFELSSTMSPTCMLCGKCYCYTRSLATTSAFPCEVFTGPKMHNNVDGTQTPHFRTKTRIELGVYEGLSAACTDSAYNMTKRVQINCNMDVEDAIRAINTLLDHPSAQWAKMCKLRMEFCKEARVFVEDAVASPTGALYKRYSVVLRHKEDGNNQTFRCVSFILCGTENNCTMFVTANTAQDRIRWMHTIFKQVDTLGQKDPRLRGRAS